MFFACMKQSYNNKSEKVIVYRILGHWGKWQHNQEAIISEKHFSFPVSAITSLIQSHSYSSCLCVTFYVYMVSVEKVVQAYIYIRFHLTSVFLQGLPSIPPSCHTFNPEAPAWSPAVGPQLIHQICQSAPSLYIALLLCSICFHLFTFMLSVFPSPLGITFHFFCQTRFSIPLRLSFFFLILFHLSMVSVNLVVSHNVTFFLMNDLCLSLSSGLRQLTMH